MKFGLFFTQLWRKRTTESLDKIRRFWLFDEYVENKLINGDLTTKLCAVSYLQKNCGKQFDIVLSTFTTKVL